VTNKGEETEREKRKKKKTTGVGCDLNPTRWPGFGWRTPSDIRGDPAEGKKKAHFHRCVVNYVGGECLDVI
jgi:hypothetical protein